MNDDRSGKNFDATPARKLKARREGNIARSGELSAVAAFACATLATFAALPLLVNTAAAALVHVSTQRDLTRLPGSLASVLAIACLPAVAAAAGGLGANIAQAGGVTLSAPKLQLARLNPVAGLKRMIGGEAIVGAARAIVAFAVATLALWPLSSDLLVRATTLSNSAAFGELFAAGAQRACWVTIGVGVVFAGADYALVRRRWLRDLKMTLEEVRRDQKESEGDPHTRSRRKSLHRTLVRGSIGRTKDASFVVVNPTHIAIALRYAPPAIAVPEILVRATDAAALRVKSLAAARGIPIVENVALARALFAQGEAGRTIPPETFVAVARIIAELVRAGALA